MKAILDHVKAEAKSKNEPNGRRKRGVVDPVGIRRRLLDERRSLIAVLLTQGAGDELVEGWQERDSPSEEEIREVEYMRREAHHLRLGLVDEALERLRLGTYGLCAQCSRGIAVERLESDPAMSLCIGCARAIEESAQAQPL
jgi:RNA polymerase-binding transcription factor DksA